MVKRSNLLAITLLIIGYCTSAVTAQSISDKRSCGSDERHMEKMRTDSEYAAKYVKRQAELARYIKNQQDQPQEARALRTIPTVIHIVDGSFSDAQVQAEIDVLTADYRGLNSDNNKTPSAFTSLIGDSFIEFCLATTDPNGAATTGITRNNACESGAWDRRRYLNIWVCDIGALGYSNYLSQGYDGTTVIDDGAFAPGGGGNYGMGRTATHEVGHYLGLFHIWGDASCGNDQVSDTPTQQSSNGGCPSFPKVSCSNGPNGDMHMNYMDYTYDRCMYMFSKGQADRMNAVLDQYGQGFFTNSGCTNENPPSINFSANITSGCETLIVNFSDKSSNDPSSWLWDFGDGSNSTSQNPTHTFTTAGIYNVKLTATNTFGSNNQTQSSLINVGTGNTYPPVKGGPIDSALGAGRMFTDNDLRGLFFDVMDTIYIESVKVYSNAAGERTIQVLTGGDTGPILASRVVNIPAGESRVTLDISVPPGSQYYMKVSGGTIGLYRNSIGTAFPYVISNLLSITGTNASGTGYYYYFYDWQVREDGCDGILGVDSPKELPIHLYPNPAKEMLGIDFGSNTGQARIEIFSVVGALVFSEDLGVLSSTNKQINMDISELPSGSYIVKVNVGDKVHTKRLLKTGL